VPGIAHLLYLAILAACVLGTLPLEFVLHTRVYARWRQLALTLLPVVVLFGGWDLLAIHRGDWTYDRAYLVGLTLPGRLPVEELLFFLVIPTCAVLALEAVRARRPHWLIGDEPSEARQ
jgi:lycopene cyclase domain-containing protein